MPKQEKIKRLPDSVWQAEMLRLTAFPTELILPQNINWWTELVGEPAEIKTLQPRIGGQIEQGLIGTKNIQLANHIRPHRIDWLLQMPEQGPERNTFPAIGQYSEVIEQLVDLMARWFKLKTCPVLQRLAFGAILTYPVDNLASGYQQLSTYLPSVKLDPGNSSDFLYQINRVRDSTSGIDNLRINRLSKWSVAAVQTMGFTVGQDLDMSVAKGGLLRACRLELDINTITVLKKPLPPNKLNIVFKELIKLAKEIIKEGDIP